MLKSIVKTEFRGAWRRNQTWPLICLAWALCCLAAIIPHRLSSGSSLWSESFLATQLLVGLIFVLLVTVWGMAEGRFLWGTTQVGPLNTRSEWIICAQSAGQSLALLSIMAPVFLFQVTVIPWLTGYSIEPGFASRSLAVFGGCLGLMAWGRLLAVIIPTSAAMLSTVGIVVVGQFFLNAHADPSPGPSVFLSPGLEFLYSTTQGVPTTQVAMTMLGLVMSVVATSNLLSAWILETWRGSLCVLDHGEART